MRQEQHINKPFLEYCGSSAVVKSRSMHEAVQVCEPFAVPYYARPIAPVVLNKSMTICTCNKLVDAYQPLTTMQDPHQHARTQSPAATWAYLHAINYWRTRSRRCVTRIVISSRKALASSSDLRTNYRNVSREGCALHVCVQKCVCVSTKRERVSAHAATRRAVRNVAIETSIT